MEAVVNMTPKFMFGKIYFVDNFLISSTLDFVKEFDEVHYEMEWDLSRGVILFAENNEKIKFDIDPGPDYYGSYFTGFLYSDHTINGKIKYNYDANLEDAFIKGMYKRINKNRILICGTWDEANGEKEYFWIELTK